MIRLKCLKVCNDFLLCLFICVSCHVVLNCENNIQHDPQFLNKLKIDKKKSLIWKLRDVHPINEKKIVIIVPSFNNAQRYQRNLDSLFGQKYSNYQIIYIDDASTDNTGNLVEQYVKDLHQENRFILIKNSVNTGALANLVKAVYMCADSDIIASCDGDDWWCSENVLDLLNKIYENSNVWLTYGNVIWCSQKSYTASRFSPYSNDIIKQNKYRDVSSRFTGLRTYYAWLFKKIKLDDLKYENKYFGVLWDNATEFPMFEMAGGRHQFIPDVLYAYDIATGLNDRYLYQQRIKKIDSFIRNQMTRYTKI